MASTDIQLQYIQSHLETYQELADQYYSVPPLQAQPIATRPDIAFRPSCAQIEVQPGANQTQWVWQGEILHQTPGLIAPSDRLSQDLHAAGVCVDDEQAIAIPVVPTATVMPQLQQAIASARDAVTLVETPSDELNSLPLITGWSPFVIAPIPWVVLGIGVVMWRCTRPKSP